MILVCPACDAKFKIPDGAIPPEGRKVRCAKCKHSWHAVPGQILKRPVVPQPGPGVSAVSEGPVVHEDMDAGAAARAAAIRRSMQGGDGEAVPPPPPEEDDLFDEDGAPEPAASGGVPDDHAGGIDFDSDDFGIGAIAREKLGDDLVSGDEDEYPDEEDSPATDEEEYDEGDFVARRRAEQRREAVRQAQARKRKLMLFGWMALLLLWLFVLFSLVFMRDTVVKTLPGMNGFYQMFEGVRDVDRFRPEEGEPLSTPMTEREVYVTAKLYGNRTGVETIGGRQVLVVRGFVENTGTSPGAMTASVPQVQVDILDRRGRVLETVIADPPGFAIRRGNKLDFETTVYPVPSGTANVSVKVLEGTRSRTVPGASG